MGSMVYSI